MNVEKVAGVGESSDLRGRFLHQFISVDTEENIMTVRSESHKDG